jgi:predicted transcriptional regulator
MIERVTLEKLYVHDKLSMMQISQILECSPHKIEYWMKKYQLQRLSISDAVYRHNNPNGDPFKLKPIKTADDAYLFGMGIGLYWGEGHKRSKHSVRLANTDPEMIKIFRTFLINICGIDTSKLRYSLQVFSDIDPQVALKFWIDELKEDPSKFGKVTVSQSGSIGTYKHKNETGVLILNFHNYKLRDIIVKSCRDSSVGRAHPW